MSESLKNENALVLVSGGQDSTTCLYWALNNFNNTYAITFQYGQKHSLETEIANDICDLNNVPLRTLDITFMKTLVTSSLLDDSDNMSGKHKLNENVPATFVPYRNMIFITLAAAWSSTIGAKHLVTGVCETDYSGYADCRDVFIKSLQASLNLATDFKDNSCVIHTPLMWLNKEEEFKMAQDLGCLDIIISKTLTCYNGVTDMNDFGMGCRKCPACKLREEGYRRYVKKYRE